MDPNTLIDKLSDRYTLKDVQDQRVETVSVVGVDELSSVIESLVLEEVSKKTSEMAASAGGGGLEQAAAEAALEAEAKALEAKAEAEQRAQNAEAKVAQLEAQLSDAASGGAAAEELEGKVKDLENQLQTAQAEADKVAGLEKQVADLQAEADRIPELEKQVKEAQEKAAEASAEPDDDGNVTDDDIRRADRLAQALLEDVFSDDEDKTNEAIKAGTFRTVFEKELKNAHRNYNKRIKASVRAEKDFWEDTITKFLLRDW